MAQTEKQARPCSLRETQIDRGTGVWSGQRDAWSGQCIGGGGLDLSDTQRSEGILLQITAATPVVRPCGGI